jgi:EAL domain-containing protein (putative c-di-GMP-specific phosphodiesterase class I)
MTPQSAGTPSLAAQVEPGLESPLSAAIAARDAEALAMVRRAIDTRSVLLAFQPVLPMKDGVAAQHPAFHEALLRILDPSGRIIPARDFVAAAEMDETGRLLDCIALQAGIAALRRTPDLCLSVNMSARSIGYPRWTETLRRGLNSDPTLGARLVLEITESSALLMPEIVRSFMQGVQRRGVTFALDDFGGGYTSFRVLRDFCFDMVKLDGQFIRDIDTASDTQVMTGALIALARNLDMYSIAPKIETAGEAAVLASLGVDFVQGFHFGPPVTTPDWGAKQPSTLGKGPAYD